jgi:hypothetical protein
MRAAGSQRRGSARWTMLAVGLAATPAAAQNLPPDESIRFSRYTAVRERQIPGYEQAGIPVGGFTLTPSLDANANATDNVFALQDDRFSDAFLRLQPSARLSSNWAGRSLDISGDAAIDRYARQTTENVNAVNLSANAVQQFAGTLKLRLLGRFRANRESRESQNAFALTVRPVAFRETTGALGLSRQFGPVQLAGEAGYQRLNFDNAQLRSGGILDQNYRDGGITSFRGRADLIQSTALAYFVQATNTESSYSQLSSAGVRRGANTTEVLAGARFELPILARGEIGVGYITSAYRDQQFRRFSGLAVNSRVTFFPTQLTTVTVNALRSVNDAGTPDSSTYVSLLGGVQVDHELLRSVIIGANLQYQRDSFNGVDRQDRRFSVGASAEYRLNRLLSVRASFDRLDLTSNGAARYKSFTRNRALVGLGVRI